jgi:TRAP-type C4-dicarboxylate transport system permease small subunit
MAIRDERHLNINICKSIFPGFVLKLISLGNYILIFGFSLFMVFEGYGLTILTKRNILPGMGVPASVLYISIPISGLLFCLAAGEKFLQLLRRSGNDLKESGCRDGL